MVYGIIALSLVVLTGWAGEISLGQMAFVAVGAAVGASLTARLGWDLALGLLGAGVVGAALAALIGLPVLRRRGLTLAVITLAFGLATTAWLLSPRIFGDGTRFDWLPPPRVERPHLFGVIDVQHRVALLPPLPRGAGARDRRPSSASVGAGPDARWSRSARTTAPRARSA